MDNHSLAALAVETFKSRKMTLSFAESCTGGLASATVVSVAGASEVFFGGIVSYDNSVKRNLLFVDGDILNTVGAVSAECAIQMASGARKQLGTDVAVSVTGIAGPGGGTPQKPVGLVYIGIASSKGKRSLKLVLSDKGDRTAIREAAVGEMLKAAIEELD